MFPYYGLTVISFGDDADLDDQKASPNVTVVADFGKM